MVFLSYFSPISYKMKTMQFKKGVSVGTFTLQSIILSQQILIFNKVKVKNASFKSLSFISIFMPSKICIFLIYECKGIIS